MVKPELSIAGHQRGSSDIMDINWEQKDHLSKPTEQVGNQEQPCRRGSSMAHPLVRRKGSTEVQPHSPLWRKGQRVLRGVLTPVSVSSHLRSERRRG